MKRTAVYIATTEGPSEIQRITPEDCDVRSVVCHDGKAIALPISADYDSFVRRPTGVIEACFGHSAFRIDVAHPIGSGLSWQLGLFIAHALHDEGVLVPSDDKTPQIVWATGEVMRDLSVAEVEDIDLKIRRSEDLIRQHLAAGTRIVIAVPAANLPDAAPALAELFEHDLDRITVLPAETVFDVSTALGLKPRRRMRQWLAAAPSAIASRGRAPRTLSYAVSLSLIAATLITGWHKLGLVADATPVAGQTGKEITIQGAKVLQAVLRTETPVPLSAMAVATRAPAGHPCAAVHLDRVAASTTENMVAENSPSVAVPAAGLCDFRYRVVNKTDQSALVWVMAHRETPEAGSFRIRSFHAGHSLEPGATLVLDARPPRALSGELRQSFMVLSLAAGDAPRAAAIGDLWQQALRASTGNNLARTLEMAQARGAGLRRLQVDFRP